MANTHLCGSIYGAYPGLDRCEHLNYVTEEGQMHGKKPLRRYHVYCTAGGRCRSMGCVASFTGNSPTWCPKRKEMEQHG